MLQKLLNYFKQVSLYVADSTYGENVEPLSADDQLAINLLFNEEIKLTTLRWLRNLSNWLNVHGYSSEYHYKLNRPPTQLYQLCVGGLFCWCLRI